MKSKEKIAKAISIIFFPHLSLLYTLITYMYFSPPKSLIITIIVITVFYYLAPSIVLMLHSRKLRKTIDEMTGRERLPIIISGGFSYMIAYLLFLKFNDYSMAKITLFLLIFTVIFGIFSIFSKPSFHVGALTGGIIFLALSFNLMILVFLIIIPIVGWSRIVLKAHTKNQTILGAFLGATLSFIFSVI